MKDGMVAMDVRRTGRVPIAKFYHSGERRFAESEAYLREQGSLDETSRWVGQQVLVANYLQAASNAVILTPHYCIICRNDCQAIMGEVEMELQGPEATPARILEVVGNMTEDFEAMGVAAAMANQLEKIAEQRSGLVPIHGRLFAQWLHYVFPRECPYPHKHGASKMTKPREFAANASVFVSPADKKRHAENAAANPVPETMTRDDLEWMSQWDHEEELVAEHTFAASRSLLPGSLLNGVGVLGFLVMAILSALRVVTQVRPSGKASSDVQLHYV